MTILRRTLALLTTALLLLPTLVYAQTTDVLVLTPVAAPDGNGEITSVIRDPAADSPDPGYGAVLNDAGQVAFWGFLTGTAGSNYEDNSGLFLYDEGEVVQLVRAGQPAPDGDGVFYYVSEVNLPALNADGTLVLSQLITDNDSGEFFEKAGLAVDETGQDLRFFLREGDPSPDGNSTIKSVFTPSLTDTGRLGFTGEFVHPTNPLGTRGIFRGDVATGDIEVIARETDGPPDGDGTFDLLRGGTVNEAGQLVFETDVAGTDELDDEGIYLVEPDGTTMTEVVRVGDPVPGTTDVVDFFLAGPRIPLNEQGQFVYGVASSPTTSSFPTGATIFRYDGGDQVKIARTGEAAPGGGTYAVFGRAGGGSFRSIAPALNEQGQVAFVADADRNGLLFTGIFRSDGTEETRIVDNGMLTPSGNGYFLFTSLCCIGVREQRRPQDERARPGRLLHQPDRDGGRRAGQRGHLLLRRPPRPPGGGPHERRAPRKPHSEAPLRRPL